MTLMHGGNQDNRKPVRVLDAGHLEGILVTVSIEYPRGKTAYHISNGQPEYIGVHEDASATVADPNWIITKYAFNASDDVIDFQTLVRAWTGMTGGAWNI